MSDTPSTPLTPTPLADSVIEAVSGLKEAAETRAREFTSLPQEPFTGWKDLAARLLGDPEGKWKEAATQLSAYIRENPGKTILTGVSAGLALGLLFPPKQHPDPLRCRR